MPHPLTPTIDAAAGGMKERKIPMKLIQISLLILTVASCAAWVPTPTHPCPNLYCAEWTVAGTDVMICAETKEALQLKIRSLKAQ